MSATYCIFLNEKNSILATNKTKKGSCNMKKLEAVEIQKGVTLWLEKSSSIYWDIDVEPGIKTVALDCTKDLDGDFAFTTKKSFPDVETLKIGPNVYYINISNYMFPNVKHIESDNDGFLSGPLLINDTPEGMHLQNVFCKKEDEVIDLKGIQVIDERAFSGCESTNIINTNEVTECNENAFEDSVIEKMPFDNNGLKILDGILIDIDLGRDCITIPDVNIHTIKKGISLERVKKMDLHSENVFNLLSTINCHYPEYVKITFPVSKYDMHALSVLPGNKYLDIVDSEIYKSIDGMVYSKDGTILISCPDSRDGHIEIPEGVKTIHPCAFAYRPIESVKFPSTLTEIGSRAFSSCQNLKSIEFGSGVAEIGSNICDKVFSGCKSLKTVIIPEQVKKIGKDAFRDCGLISISLPEGLRIIEDGAFYRCGIESISIPESVDFCGADSLSGASEIRVGKYNTWLLPSFTYECRYPRDIAVTKLIICESGEDRIAVVPRKLSNRNVRLIDDILKRYFTEKDASKYGAILKEVYGLFKFGITMSVREGLAIKMYKNDRHNAVAAKYIFLHSPMITEWLIKEGNKEKIMDFIKLKMINKSSLKKILEQALQNNWIDVSAYALDLLGKSEGSEFDI